MEVPDELEVESAAEAVGNDARVPPESTEVTTEGIKVPSEATVVTPEGIVVTPEATVVTPEDIVVTPEGTVVTPEGTEVILEGVEVVAEAARVISEVVDDTGIDTVETPIDEVSEEDEILGYIIISTIIVTAAKGSFAGCTNVIEPLKPFASKKATDCKISLLC